MCGLAAVNKILNLEHVFVYFPLLSLSNNPESKLRNLRSTDGPDSGWQHRQHSFPRLQVSWGLLHWGVCLKELLEGKDLEGMGRFLGSEWQIFWHCPFTQTLCRGSCEMNLLWSSWEHVLWWWAAWWLHDKDRFLFIRWGVHMESKPAGKSWQRHANGNMSKWHNLLLAMTGDYEQPSAQFLFMKVLVDTS